MFRSFNEWLGNRSGIGGSDASAVLGLNPYKSNTELWEEKTGKRVPEDISHKDYVQYGHDAEPLLRKLFALDYPEYKVEYYDNPKRKISMGTRLFGWRTGGSGGTPGNLRDQDYEHIAIHAAGEMEKPDPG